MADAVIKTVSLVGGGFLVLTMFCVATNLRAQQAAKPHDVESCKDSPLIKRMPGTIVGDCPHKDFDQVAAPVGMKDGEPISKTLEGKVQKWKYSTQPDTSALTVFRNIDTALKKAGFTIVWESSPGMITAHKGNAWYILDTGPLAGNNGYYEQTIVTVH